MNKKLRALIDRAERLIAEREEANEGIRDLRKEVKSGGWDATQIMRLAQLSYDDKKRAKLATANETLALYNRESGLGLVLGLDESEADASPRKDEVEAGGDAGDKRRSSVSDTIAEQARQAHLAANFSPPPRPFDPNAKCQHAYIKGAGDGKFACVFCGEITFDRALVGPAPPRSEYASPESGAVAAPSPLSPGDVEHLPPAAAPDTEYLADAAANYTEALGAIREGIVARGEARLKTTAELVAALHGDPGLIDRRRL